MLEQKVKEKLPSRTRFDSDDDEVTAETDESRQQPFKKKFQKPAAAVTI